MVVSLSILEKYLDSKTKRAILRTMIFESHRDFSIAELSRKLDIDKSLISKVMAELEKDNLIKTGFRGPMKLCEINKDSKTFIALSNIFKIDNELKKAIGDGHA